jgi:hypothetical protein
LGQGARGGSDDGGEQPGMVRPRAARPFRYDAAVKTWGGFPSKPNADETHASTQPPVAPPQREGYRLDDAALPFSALLDVLDEGGMRSAHPFRHPRMLIGRTADNDLALNDANVSTRHCELLAEQGCLVVRDLGSANGTFVNEQRVSEARLKNGDVVRAGKTQIAVSLREKKRVRKIFGGRRKWLWLAAVAVAAGGAWAWSSWRESAARDSQAVQRYTALVRATLGQSVCGRDTEEYQQLASTEANLARGSIFFEKRGDRVGARGSFTENLRLLTWWRMKERQVGKLIEALGQRTQSQRDDLERLTRMGARLGSGKDRKIAYFIDGLMAERLRAADPLVQSLRDVRQRTDGFVASVERVARTQDANEAEALKKMQLGPDADELLKRCEADQARATSGVQGALNGFEE